MTARSLARWLARLGAVAVLVPGSASAADVRVMISAGFYEAYAELGPAFERASGHRRRRFPPASHEARQRTS